MKRKATSLNPEQRLVAETFGRPIAAMAGAGSGKTFTLVERIVNAFDPELVEDESLRLEGIDQVLAITFTEKAASELKSRIRSGLKASGRDEEALLVDDAWISTIHSMCRRILQESALDLGIDPNFSVLEQDDAKALLDDVLERVLVEDPEVREQALTLLGEYDRQALKGFIRTLIEKAAQSALGFHALSLGVGDEALLGPDADGAGEGAPQGAMPEADGDPSSASSSALASWLDEELDLLGVEGTDEERRTYLLMNQRLSLAAKFREPLLVVARRVRQLFLEEKRTRGVFDNNDLLVETYRVLQDDDILERYRDRFRLVIVDEFQDTDMLQLGIIEALSGEDDRRLCVVGDVKQSIYRFRGADLYVSQRHVSGLEERDGAAGTQSVFDMGTNYRSHGRILDFTNLLFSDLEPADDEPKLPFPYRGLGHGRDEARLGGAAFDEDLEGPRIEVVEAQYCGNLSTDARKVLAHHIARRFRAIHDAGLHGYGSMVVLLNSMTSAGTYAKALEDAGIPCAITGGSVFRSHDVPKLLVHLVRLLGNPLEDVTASVVLESGLFDFDPEDFLDLARVAELEGAMGRHIPVGESLAACLERRRDPEMAGRIGDARPKVRRAIEVLGRAIDRIGFERVSDILGDVLYDAGWLSARYRTQGDGTVEGFDIQGMAEAADALKLIRMARDLEDEGVRGPRDLSVRLRRRFEGAATPPGILATDSNEFVRIMTIHASKGLEYPVVAIGELAIHLPNSIDVGLTATSEGRTYALLDLGRSKQSLGKDLEEALKASDARSEFLAKVRGAARRLLGEDPDGSSGRLDEKGLAILMEEADRRHDLALRFLAIQAYEEDAERAELMRKTYVALTRAREALILCLPVQVSAGARDEGLLDVFGKTAAVKKVKAGERNLYVCPKVQPICGDNEVTARIQRRREAIEAMGAYRLVPFAFSRKHALDGVYPAVLTEEGWDGDPSVPLAPEIVAVEEADPRALDAYEVPATYVDRPTANHRYSPSEAEGIFSASSLKDEAGEAMRRDGDEGCFGTDDDVDAEPPAYEKGTAFHELCQLAVLGRRAGEPLEAPSEARIRTIARRHRLSERQQKEIRNALEAWLVSDLARSLVDYAQVEAEVPFFVPLGEGDDAFKLNGFIDLLAHEGPDGVAPHIVDYKTGTTFRTREERERAYRTQAMVYAYAVLLQGFKEPRITFVLVEQRDGDELATCKFPPAGETWTLEYLRSELLAKLTSLGRRSMAP